MLKLMPSLTPSVSYLLLSVLQSSQHPPAIITLSHPNAWLVRLLRCPNKRYATRQEFGQRRRVHENKIKEDGVWDRSPSTKKPIKSTIRWQYNTNTPLLHPLSFGAPATRRIKIDPERFSFKLQRLFNGFPNPTNFV